MLGKSLASLAVYLCYLQTWQWLLTNYLHVATDLEGRQAGGDITAAPRA